VLAKTYEFLILCITVTFHLCLSRSQALQIVLNDQSINQSKHISIAPYVASESEVMIMMSCICSQNGI